jgi:predicted small lipoprotein YifL
MICIDRHAATFFLLVLVVFILTGSLSACGKRGEPYRPSEITTES